MTAAPGPGTFTSARMSINRRTLLAGGLSAAGASAALLLWRTERPEDPPALVPGTPRRLAEGLGGPAFDPRATAILGLLLDQLLPGDPALDLPSAREAGVLDYLERTAARPGFASPRSQILKLTRHLDLLARQRGGAGYVELGAREREALLREVEAGAPGEGRFRPAEAEETLLRLSLEGYLGHPHHGGNRQARVWEALHIDMPRERVALGHHHHP